MPYAVRRLGYGLRDHISGSAPLAGCRLSRQDKATRTCAVHLHQARCDELASPTLRVDQHPGRLRHSAAVTGCLL
jgi:hypothetical protein